MRFTIAYYLILIYIVVVIRPLIPFIHDAWSHQFNEIEHISLIHAKYGSHHLQKELAETDSDTGKCKNQQALKSEDQSIFHLFNQAADREFVVDNNPGKQYFYFKKNKLPFIFISKQHQPPKFS